MSEVKTKHREVFSELLVEVLDDVSKSRTPKQLLKNLQDNAIILRYEMSHDGVYLDDVCKMLQGANINDLIKDKRLIDLDPYSDDLTDKQKAWILDECKTNTVYFLHVVLKKNVD